MRVAVFASHPGYDVGGGFMIRKRLTDFTLRSLCVGSMQVFASVDR